MNSAAPITFVIDPLNVPLGFPDQPSGYPDWARDCYKHIEWPGQYDWTLQTYLYVKAAGLPCTLSTKFPSAGIIVAHADTIPLSFVPNKDSLLICIVGDKEQPGDVGRSPFAQLHIVQNQADPMLSSALWKARLIPFWPHANIVLRDEARADTFKTLAYFGYPRNLANELRQEQWAQTVSSLGLQFEMVPREKWEDYSQVDAVIGVRDFVATSYWWKPATKLHQAWIAGVPAILGKESAFQGERRSELDYLEVGTYDELVAAVKLLQGDANLRKRMRDHGFQRAKEVTGERITQYWIDLLTGEAQDELLRWRSSGEISRRRFLLARSADYAVFHKRKRAIKRAIKQFTRRGGMT